MDSISYGFEERGFMFSESGFELLPNDTTFIRNTKSFYQIDESVNAHNHHHLHHHDNNEVEEFMDFGLGDMLQKSPPIPSVCDDPCLFRVSSGEKIDNNNDNNDNNNNNSGDEILLSTLPSTIIIPDPNHPTLSEDIDAWRLQVPFGLASDHQTPLFPVSDYESDHTGPIFQVGHDCDKGFLLGDNNNFKKVKSLHQRSKDSSSMEAAAADDETSVVVKRPRISTSTNSQQQQTSVGIVCQVHGCFRDLSSSKEYHKRHRVCDEHSKTAKVIVDGIEQRFCQQCSRFHLLPEFDDDKRSCRKSLAGHNERRRKPQFESPHAMTGQRFFGMNAQSTHYFLPELLPVNYFGQENYELESNGNKPMKKSDEKHISFSTLELPQSAGHLFAKDLPNLHDSLPGISHHVSFLRNLANNHSGTSTLKSLTGDGLLPGVIEMEGSYCHAFDNSLGIYYETETDESFQSTESGKTIDLQQLSTHLQRVEQQRKLCSSEAAREMEFHALET
ncbi:unnamed protein product [Cuscuta europaea]|uniref:SBP-type domain-containing protein n=1 Tax=Cuscuta europaea TaxID=41803 RepID=A0A9P0ZTU6_CUSEU|nr:unnamed protein product [Cuscuta europaea]